MAKFVLDSYALDSKKSEAKAKITDSIQGKVSRLKLVLHYL